MGLEEASLSRTTMKFEVHWSNLKRLYLQLTSRPRMNLLIHIVEAKVIQNFCDDYKGISHGFKKPCL